MTRQQAIEALRAQGITNPSRQLVQDYMRLQQAEELALEVPAPPLRSESSEAEPELEPHPSSESNLEPLLRERGELVREHPRKPGRPKVVAPWFAALATRMADGTSMRKALASLGIHVNQREMRALYRNTALTAMRQEARQKWQREWGIRSRTKTRHPKGCRGADCLGFSRELRQIL